MSSSKEAGKLVDTYLKILIEFNNKLEIIRRSKNIVSRFFDKKEPTFTIIAEDIISQTSDYLEDIDDLDSLGEVLIETGHFLFRRKNFEQSVAYLERGLNYYLDTGNKEQVIDEISKILDLARRLAVKNNEYAKNYIELANRVSIEMGIDLKNDVNAQLAYQSYSEHLLKKSKTMVEERKVQPGRRHKRKRDLSTLFKKKEKEEEFY
jgi:tetratricopeptide (TPR) repeat protein